MPGFQWCAPRHLQADAQMTRPRLQADDQMTRPQARPLLAITNTEAQAQQLVLAQQQLAAEKQAFEQRKSAQQQAQQLQQQPPENQLALLPPGAAQQDRPKQTPPALDQITSQIKAKIAAGQKGGAVADPATQAPTVAALAGVLGAPVVVPGAPVVVPGKKQTGQR